jgi:dCTP deaminase
MFLSGKTIQEFVEKRNLCVDPFITARLKPSSYVLSLGSCFRRWKRAEAPIELWSPGAAEDHLEHPFEAETVTLEPGGFIIGCTVEYIQLPDNLVGFISPLSHVARFGLAINCGADLISPGFGKRAPTQLTLELANHNPSKLILSAQMPIAHLRIAKVGGDSSVAREVCSIYDGADPLNSPRFFEEMSAETNIE